jgi:hypothetical protein
LRDKFIVSLAVVSVLLGGFVTSQRCEAQAVEPREALEDAKLYFTAPLRWDSRDWLEFGGALLGVGNHNRADRARTGHDGRRRAVDRMAVAATPAR